MTTVSGVRRRPTECPHCHGHWVYRSAIGWHCGNCGYEHLTVSGADLERMTAAPGGLGGEPSVERIGRIERCDEGAA